MSMYNMVLGLDPAAGVVVGALGFTHSTLAEVPRFRDAYIDLEDEANPKLVLFTRTGGGNRSEYEEGNAALRQRPGFIDDFDDTFDSTFAHWRYAVPDEHKQMVDQCIADGKAAGWEFPKPMDRFQDAIKIVKGGTA